MAKQAKSKAIKEMSFEEAVGELEQIVSRLESGQAPLEDSIADYTRGTELKNHCSKKLAEAKMKVEKITEKEDGIETSEFDEAN